MKLKITERKTSSETTMTDELIKDNTIISKNWIKNRKEKTAEMLVLRRINYFGLEKIRSCRGT